MIIKIYDINPNERQLLSVVDELKEGNLIIYPTDTVYAIGCDALNARAVEEICKIKGIDPRKTDLSIICENLSQASEYVRIETKHIAMLRRNIPGPFTFIFNSNHRLPKVFRNRKTVGIRIPDNEITLTLVRLLGRPILTTSVRDDELEEEYITDPELIHERYKHLVTTVIDGGEGRLQPSTVIDCTGEEDIIVRQGLGELR